MKNHFFHIVDYSPWPLLGSLSAMNFLVSSLEFLKNYNLSFLFLSMVSTIFTVSLWWRDVCRESTFQGNHTLKVINGLKMGFVLFISSEVMFFFSFFFGFFFFSLNPDIEVGSKWPPVGIEVLDYFSTPLLNSFILLSSGISITWAHHSIMENKYQNYVIGSLMTLFLGLVFSTLQMLEYYEIQFTIADSVYGSIFFVATGFHGIHVIIGSIFILISTIRGAKGHFSSTHLLGFEMAAWYWHFVDVVWLFLYMWIYWWFSS